MSTLALMGMLNAFNTPGMLSLVFKSSLSFSTVMPGRHWDSGFKLMTVSNISKGAGSVAVAARPALPKTWDTSGTAAMMESWSLSSLLASEMAMAGMVAGM